MNNQQNQLRTIAQFADAWAEANGVDPQKAYHRVRYWINKGYLSVDRQQIHKKQTTVFITDDPATFQPPSAWSWHDAAPVGYVSVQEAAELLGIKRPSIHHRMSLPPDHELHLEFIQDVEGGRVWIKLPEKEKEAE